MRYEDAYNKYRRNSAFKKSIEQQILGISEIFLQADDLLISQDKTICDYYIKVNKDKIPIKSRIRSYNYINKYRNDITIRTNEIWSQAKYGIFGFVDDSNLIRLFRIIDFQRALNWLRLHASGTKKHTNNIGHKEQGTFYAIDINNFPDGTVITFVDDTIIPPYIYIYERKNLNDFFNDG